MSKYEYGERLLLPVLVHAHQQAWYVKHVNERRDHDESKRRFEARLPRTRPLWVYVIDPADVGMRVPTMQLPVPYEFLQEGPCGALFCVESPVPKEFLNELDWSEERIEHFSKRALNLEREETAMNGGLMPSTGNPHFAAQMSYAVCQSVYHRFALALGRPPVFGPWQMRAFEKRKLDPEGSNPGSRVQLLIRTHAAVPEDNAYYMPETGVLHFGWFVNKKTSSTLVVRNSIQQYALSHDMICHELAHALLDGMRSHFMLDTGPDVSAFHEAFADLIALLHHFTARTLVQQAIEETGDIGARVLLEIGRLLGETDSPGGGGAMRSAITALVEEARVDTPIADAWRYDDGHSKVGDVKPALTMINPDTGEEWTECHDRGSVLAVAVMEAFVVCFRRRARPFRRLARAVRPSEGQSLPAELVEVLTTAVSRLAVHFMRMLIRALDYCPPVDIHFGEFLRAMITADRDLAPDDEPGYRGALIRAFRRRGITIEHVLDLSEDSIAWAPPQTALEPVRALEFSQLKLTNDGTAPATEDEQRRWADVLGGYILRDEQRLRAFGLHEPGGVYGAIVIESVSVTRRVDTTQNIRHGLVAEITQLRKGHRNDFYGGCTVVMNESGVIRYTVYKRVDALGRRKVQADWQGREARTGAKSLTLKEIHARRRI